MTTSTEPRPSSELIVVTGASTGIGAATARELARRGFHVLAGVRRDSDAEALRGEPWSTTPGSRSTPRSRRSR